jgi:VanZ family protein
MHRFFKPLSLALLLACSVFFFVGIPGDLHARSARRVWDLGHVAFFFAATVAWIKWGRQSEARPLVRLWTLVLVCVTLIGLGVEGLQVVLGRSGETSDLFRNLVGAVLALAFFGTDGSPQARWKWLTIRVVAILLLLGTVSPLFVALSDEISASRTFPALSDFETPFQLSRWESDVVLSVERDTVREGDGALRVPLSTAQYSKASLEFFPGDWSSASVLLASVFNPDPDPLALNLRVHDEWHDEHGQSYADRFNTTFTITTGWNDLRVPLSEIEAGPRDRLLDLTAIAGLSFFTVELPAPRTIFIDQVELR